jgi:uncharacterized protein YodC (DUF2158 family)
MPEELKVGDTVQLKSGGPVMTIIKIGDYSSKGIKVGAWCEWFDEKKEKKGDVFSLQTLVKYDPREQDHGTLQME